MSKLIGNLNLQAMEDLEIGFQMQTTGTFQDQDFGEFLSQYGDQKIPKRLL